MAISRRQARADCSVAITRVDKRSILTQVLAEQALDPEHWTGCTGLVGLAPHLVKVKGKDVGLPHKSKASERQVNTHLLPPRSLHPFPSCPLRIDAV